MLYQKNLPYIFVITRRKLVDRHNNYLLAGHFDIKKIQKLVA